MVTRCVVCKKDSKSNVFASFHRFPRDVDQLQVWKNIIGKENVAKEGRICSSHFVESDIRVGLGGKKFLRAGAKPVLVSDASEDSIRSKNEQIIRGESSQFEPQQYKIETIYDSPESTSTSFPASSSFKTELTFNPETDHPKEAETFVNNSYKMETIYDSPEASPEPKFSTSFPASTSSETELTFRPVKDSPKGEETFVNNGYNTVFDSTQPKFLLITSANFPSIISSGTDLIPLIPEADVPKEAETLITKGKRKRRYFGDCEADDMYDPIVAKQNWEIAKKTITIQRKKIRGLQQVNRRLQSRINFLNSFIHHLKDRHLHK